MDKGWMAEMSAMVMPPGKANRMSPSSLDPGAGVKAEVPAPLASLHPRMFASTQECSAIELCKE
jgi:hypothetical protein